MGTRPLVSAPMLGNAVRVRGISRIWRNVVYPLSDLDKTLHETLAIRKSKNLQQAMFDHITVQTYLSVSKPEVSE
jgi:hypothetical protein